MNMEWKNGHLYDGEKLMCYVLRGGDGIWFVHIPCINNISYEIGARSLDEAQWKATVMLSNRCNKEANYYHQIRDHLPSIHDLAAKVFENESEI